MRWKLLRGVCDSRGEVFGQDDVFLRRGEWVCSAAVVKLIFDQIGAGEYDRGLWRNLSSYYERLFRIVGRTFCVFEPLIGDEVRMSAEEIQVALIKGDDENAKSHVDLLEMFEPLIGDEVRMSAEEIEVALIKGDDENAKSYVDLLKVEESVGKTGVDTKGSIESPRIKRSIGRKVEKILRKKSKIQDSNSSRVCSLMEEFNKNFSENAKSKKEIEQRKVQVMEDLKKIKEYKEDERIMDDLCTSRRNGSNNDYSKTSGTWVYLSL
ncbi:hypothetical protein Droror1_Dr00014995 [Drosera rotundifolia]